MKRFSISIGLQESSFGFDPTLCVGLCRELILLTNSKSWQPGGCDDEQYVGQGVKFGKLLKEMGVTSLDDVEILNGRRIRFSTREEVECRPVPQGNLVAFQEAVKSGLGEA